MKALKDYLQKSKKTDIIFDFDSTLFQLLLPWNHVFDDIRDKLVAFDAKIFRGFEAGEYNDAVTQFKYLAKFGEKANAIIVPNQQKFEKEKLRGVRVNEELVDFIKHDDEYKKYVWSGNMRASVDAVLFQNGVFDKFKKVVTREDVTQIKPDPQAFHLIYDGKTPLSQFLFVGDSASDEGAAKALGIDFFKVSF